MTNSFTEIQLLAGAWRSRNFAETSTATLQALGVAEECGELCHHILKMEQNIRGSNEYHLGQIEDAVGDIIIYLTGLCDALGLSLAQCVSKAWGEVSRRDWVNNPVDGSEP